MLTAPLIAHHPGNHYYTKHYGMASSQRSPLLDWSQMYGYGDQPSPPPPMGPPLLDQQQQIMFDQFFEEMPSNMMPLAHIFEPHIPKDTAIWPESVPRGMHDMTSHDLHPHELQDHMRDYYGHPAPPGPPMHPHEEVEVNPFGNNHLLENPPQTAPNHMHPPSMISFGSDTSFAPTGYQPSPHAPVVPDRESDISVKINAFLTRNPSNNTTRANSPSGYRMNGDVSGMQHDDRIVSPIAGLKRRAEDSEEFAEAKNARKSRPRSSEPSSKMKKKSGQKRDNLTEAQKRENHIHSEQKRRNLIRQGFEELCSMVPELKAGGYSKSAVLVHAANYLDDLKKGNARLRLYLQQLEAASGIC